MVVAIWPWRHWRGVSAMTAIERYLPPGFLLLNGVLYVLLAALFIVNPLQWFANLGIQLRGELGYTELKTMYIGLMGSLGIFSLLAAFRSELRDGALLLFFISYTALAVVRSWGIFVDQLYDDFTLQLLVAELVSAAAAGLAWYSLRSRV